MPPAAAPWIEPALPSVLESLSRKQRVAVILGAGYRWADSEVAALLGIEAAAMPPLLDQVLAQLGSGLGDEAVPGRSVGDQLAAYAEVLDAAAPDLSELTPNADTVATRPPRPPWVAAAAVISALVLVAGLAGLGSRTPTTVPPGEPAISTSRAPVPPLSAELLNPRAITPETFPDRHRYAGPGGVTVHENRFHMLSAAYGDAVANVAYAVSDDGVVWRQGAAQPVLDLAEAPWAPRELDQAVPRSLIVDREGRWQLFFEISWLDRATDEARSSIGRAVASDPEGVWVFDAEPILRPEPGLPWMSRRVVSPAVIATDEGLVMVFVGHGDQEGGAVGLAQSSSGASWQVRPGPVLVAADEWERGGVSSVDLVAAPNGFAMFFAAATPSRRGLAVSRNGLEWARHPANPLLSGADVPRASIYDTEFAPAGPSLLALVETGETGGDREVAVLRFDVDLGVLIDVLVPNS